VQPNLMSNWRLAVGLLAVGAYALLSHVLMLYAADRPWAVLAIFAPLLVGVLGVALRRRDGLTIAATLAVLAALGWVVFLGGVGDANRLYVAQHAGIHLALFGTFAATLRPGGLPLISRLAKQLHGFLTPTMAAYTRRLTGVWALYFLGMALLSVWIYWACAWSTWSAFANIATPLSAALFFVVEYLVRYALHPEFERVSIADAVRAYSAAPATDKPAGPPP
jgi:uncharacterized membrane protein